jgi:hypothetical protein
MEQFTNPDTQQPLLGITLAEGETRIVALKKFALGNPPAVVVLSKKPDVAICHQVSHLLDPTKQKYDHWSNIGAFTDELVPVERNGLYFFQIAGQKAGTTELNAPFMRGGTTPYAAPLTVTITATTNQPITLAPVPFTTLWTNHPRNPLYPGQNGLPLEHPCKESGDSLVGQCMVRFCTMLERSGASFTGLTGETCRQRGADHAHHFINPYDFAKWKRSNAHFVWQAKSPLQPEPMPGIAAFWFLAQKQGVIVFRNYFPTTHEKGKKGKEGKGKDMVGGHIDLWNRVRMGNTFSDQNPYQGEAAFMRAERIEFWPVN